MVDKLVIKYNKTKDKRVLEEIVDVYICLEKLNEKLEIIPEDFDSIYISKVTRYNDLMNK